jgi:hypothetical protein
MFRKCGLLLLLLASCSTTEPKPLNQVAIPWVAPLVGPKPVVMPVPVGLTPPVTVMVDPRAQQSPETEGAGSNRKPPAPLTSGSSPKCVPETVPHLGGDAVHNRCADRVPQNSTSGFDVLVNGKRFDAMQSASRILWEVKTDNFDTYRPALRRIVIENQVEELQRERTLARACGVDFRVGVRSTAHRAALELQDPSLSGIIIVMDWC